VWIAEIEAERATYTLGMRRTDPRPHRMTEAEIKVIVDKLANVVRVLHDADPEDKGEIFRQLGLKLTYYPGRRLVQARSNPCSMGFSTVSEGRVHQKAHPAHRS
jgi:hypothetical protein